MIKRSLITGGTGSFGQLFIKTIIERYEPRRDHLLARRVGNIKFEMQQEFNDPCMRYFIGDVRDANRLTMAMRGVDYVVHAAALKQVPAS